MALRTVEVAHRDDYNFGVGADLASGSPMGFVVDGTPEGIAQAGGAQVTFEVRRINSTEELEESLGVSAEASYGSGLFGAGISARFGYAKNCKVQSSSLFMLVTARIVLEHLSIKAPKLTASAAELRSNAEQFAARYGNMFVRGMDRGGLFVGVFRYDVHSEQERTSVSAELEGSYGLFSAEARMKFDSIRSKYHCDAFVSMHHEGGPTDLQITDVTDPVQLMDNANQWLKAFHDDPDRNAMPYTVTLAPIAIAEGPLPLNEIDIQHAQDVLMICAKQRSRILDKINLLEYVVDHSEAYDWTSAVGTTVASLTEAVNGFQQDLDIIAGCASRAINIPGEAKMPADFAEETGQTYPAGAMPPLPTPKPPPPAENIQVGNLLGIDLRAWNECLHMLGPGHGYTIDEMLAGVDVYEDGHPVQLLSINREQAVFMEQVLAGKLIVQEDPQGLDPDKVLDVNVGFKITEQDPVPNSIVPVGTTLTVKWTQYVP